ncbi:MAG: indole-3-glycerol phosphate synthase TrpC [Actinomycetes bacterium]
MPTYLDDLLDGARRRVAAARATTAETDLRARAEATREAATPHAFRAALARPGVGVIAEVKRASPSKGDLAPHLDAVAQGTAYRDGGAAAVSVLTEPERFKGTLEDLAGVASTGVPALRKDFLVDAWQVWEAAAAGASAVLLIVAALDDATLAGLHAEAHALGLDCLVEVHDAAELARATAAGAEIVGVNARDLRTFTIDRDAFARLRPDIDGIAVAESGIRGPEDVRTAHAQGADAVLVGESLVTHPDPRAAVAALVAAGAAAEAPSA